MLGPLKEMADDEENNHFVRWFKTKVIIFSKFSSVSFLDLCQSFFGGLLQVEEVY